MNQGQSKQNPKKPNPYIVGDNVMETVRSIGASVGTTALNETTQKLPDNFVQDIFGVKTAQEEVHPNEPISFQQEQPRVSPQDVIHTLTTREKTTTDDKLKQLRDLLTTLAPKTKNAEVKKAVIEQPEKKPGIYHENRLERFIETAKKLLTNPDDGLTWFKEAGKRKRQKGFWGNYKTHGTTFGLSSERTAATQSG